MKWFDLEIVGGLVVLWVSLTIIRYFYNKLTHPYVRVVDFGNDRNSVDLIISHQMSNFPITLGKTPQTFIFEGVEYRWNRKFVPDQKKKGMNEVFTLCIDKRNGGSKEVFRVDFTNHELNVEYAV